MAIIMPKEQGWGGAIGEGLGSGLQALMNTHVSHMQERRAFQKKRAITQAMGWPDEYAHMDENTLGKLAQQDHKYKMESPSRQAYAQGLESLYNPQNMTQPVNAGQMSMDPSLANQNQQLGQPTQQQLGGQSTPNNQHGMPQQQENQPFNIPPELNERQAYQLATLKGQQEERSFREQSEANRREDAKQHQIELSNKPFRDELEKGRDINRQAKKLAERLKKTWATGKVSTGFEGRYASVQSQNKETQLFVKDAKSLVGLLVAQQKGAPTGFKIKFNEDQKPSIELNHDTQGEMIDNILEAIDEVDERGNAFDSLIRENNYKEPAQLAVRVRERIDAMDEAPPIPQGAKEGDEGYDEYGQLWRIVNGEMKKIRRKNV